MVGTCEWSRSWVAVAINVDRSAPLLLAVSLFYLEVTDFDDTEPPLPDEDHAPGEPRDELPPLISLSAITGIRTEDTMQVRHRALGKEFKKNCKNG